MIRPESVKHNSRGHIIVSDFGNHRVQVFTAEGTYLRTIGKEGKNPGEFRCPVGLALDKYDNLYVTDMGNNRVQVFDAEGELKYIFDETILPEGDMGNLHGIIVDDAGFIYLAATANNRIHKLQVIELGL
jgi:DNA-binding beta-propeller fold protein YncE